MIVEDFFNWSMMERRGGGSQGKRRGGEGEGRIVDYPSNPVSSSLEDDDASLRGSTYKHALHGW